MVNVYVCTCAFSAISIGGVRRHSFPLKLQRFHERVYCFESQNFAEDPECYYCRYKCSYGEMFSFRLIALGGAQSLGLVYYSYVRE